LIHFVEPDGSFLISGDFEWKLATEFLRDTAMQYLEARLVRLLPCSFVRSCLGRLHIVRFLLSWFVVRTVLLHRIGPRLNTFWIPNICTVAES
jgi:hypothetical protein